MIMKNNTLFASTCVFLILFFSGMFTPSFGQGSNKEVFNTAVDRINCATIEFIHREQGRAEQANTMDCLSFESILKSIPADEAGSTGALCKSINAYKTKFKEDKPLDAQISEVIKYAQTSITKKKRKGNVEDYKAKLESFKKEAIENAGGAAKKPDKPVDNTTANNKPADTAHAITETVTEEPAKAGSKKTDWLGLLSLLVALGALGLAYMAYSKAKRTEGSGPGNANTGNTSRESTEAAMREIKRVENKMNSDIADIHRKLEEKSPVPAAAPVQNQTTPTPPKPEKEIVSSFIQVPPHTDATPEPKMTTSEPKMTTQEPPKAAPEPPKTIPVVENPKHEDPAKTETRDEFHHTQPDLTEKTASETAPEMGTTIGSEKSTPSVDLFVAASPRTEPMVQPRGMMTEEPKETAVEEPFMPEKEYEDGEAVPFYMFAGLPNADGSFGINSFTTEAEPGSVYEIEMYEDVPDKAFFSLLPNPEVIRKALADPAKYLAPCCSYTGDPEGKRAIVLVEEGMLRKQDDKWSIYEKAKISFE
jgi:hypothetical protein